MLGHTTQEFMQFLPYWGYPVMFVLMVLEGPIVTIISAFFASLGFFNVFAVFALSVAGDVAGDIILYYIGYFGGQVIIRKAQKFLRVRDSVIEKIKHKFHENSAKIVFYVKSPTGL